MFIEGKKFKSLREAAKNGDERAAKILRGYLDGDDSVSDMLDEYFAAPVEIEAKGDAPIEEKGEEPKLTGLERFLADNGIDKNHPEYDDYVKSYNEEFGIEDEEKPEMPEEINEEKDIMKSLIDDEVEAIEGYDRAILNITNNLDIDEVKRTFAITNLQKIKSDEIEHIAALREIAKQLKIELTEEKQQDIL